LTNGFLSSDHEKSPATAKVTRLLRPRGRLLRRPPVKEATRRVGEPSASIRLVLTWAELEQAAPEIAGHGRKLLEQFEFVLVGTLTKDGSPRVTPVEAYVIDGHLLVNMIPAR
jgi:hypothetical protein